MSKKAVESIYDALFSLTDIRVILRSSAPNHILNLEEKEAVRNAILRMEEDIRSMKEELIE